MFRAPIALTRAGSLLASIGASAAFGIAVAAVVATTSSTPARAEYAVVAEAPRLLSDGENFSLYFGLWRTLEDSEKQALKAAGNRGVMLSERAISWSTQSCADNIEISKDSERLWYADEIAFDPSGTLIPSPYAALPDHLYFVQFNLNGLFLKSQDAFVAPARQPGEHGDAYRDRYGKLFAEWRARHVPKGAQGTLRVDSEHRLVTGRLRDRAFRTNEENERATATAPLTKKLGSDHWPIYFDERAHKPHSYSRPSSWDTSTPVTTTRIVHELKWNWCDTQSREPELSIKRLEGPYAFPGQSRPGRDTIGRTVEIED